MRHFSSARIDLMWFHKMWTGPKVDKDKHFLVVSLSSCFEKGDQSMVWQSGVLLRNSGLIEWSIAELYD